MSKDNHSKVLEILSKSRGVTFTGGELLSFHSPCVYIVLRGDLPVYVGFSRRGLGRVLDHRHHVLRTKLEPADQVQVWFTDSASTAKALERMLIQTLKPLHNQQNRHESAALAARLGVTSSRVRGLLRAMRPAIK